MNASRRALLRRAGVLTLTWLCACPLRAWGGSAWLDVRTLGARGDGATKDTRAIQAAIDAAGTEGGTVFFPPGEYVSGTLKLRSRVTVRLAAGATLIASPDDADFDPREKPAYDSFADRETTDYAFALLQGHGVRDVAIVGPGRIDGNRSSRGGPKPVALKRCRHVTVRDVTFDNAPNYNISLLGCDGVEITGVTIRNGYADGIDPDCSRNVRITRCLVESRDDAICLKASLALGARRATENVVVSDCALVNVRNGLKIGTETSGDFRNIVFRSCTISGRAESWKPYPRDWKPMPSAGVSIQSVDGGRLEQVSVSDVTMTGVRAPLFVRLGARGRGQPVRRGGTLTRVVISGIVATGAEWTSSITGVPGHPVSDIALKDIRIASQGGGEAAWLTREVPEKETEYPDATRFRHLPAHGLYCRHVTGLTVDRTTLTVDESDPRPAVVLDDVRQAALRTIDATAPDRGPIVWLRSVRGCRLIAIRAHPEADALVRLSGHDTSGVEMVTTVPRSPQPVVLLDAEVNPAALQTDDTVIRRAG